jgi:hypothetical protein
MSEDSVDTVRPALASGQLELLVMLTHWSGKLTEF